MKVAGTLTLLLGIALVCVTFLYQNDTGKSSPLELLAGIALIGVSIFLFTRKPKGK